MEAFAAPAIAILVFAIILIFTTVKSVPQGENWTVERFGRYTRTLDPGLRFLIPLVDRVGRRIGMMETVLDIEEQEVITRDNAMIVADAVAFYQVVDASKAAYEVKEPRAALKNISQTNIRAVLGSMDLDEALSQPRRDQPPAAVGDRPCLDAVGGEGDAGRDPRPGAAAGHHPGDGAADEGRARQARGHPDRRGAEAGGDPEGRGRARGADPRGRGAAAGGVPRRRGARALGGGRGEGDGRWSARRSRRGDVQAINYFVAQKYTEALRGPGGEPERARRC